RCRSCNPAGDRRSEEHTSELQSRRDLVCRLLLEKKNTSTGPEQRNSTSAPCGRQAQPHTFSISEGSAACAKCRVRASDSQHIRPHPLATPHSVVDADIQLCRVLP